MGKQYTTAPILVNSNGDPIPQYLDITDKTDSPQGTFKPLTNETIQKVQLTGSNIEELVPVNSVAFTDTEARYFDADVSRYKKLYIYVRNSHNVNVDVEIRVKDGLISRVWNSDTKKFETSFGLRVVLDPFAGYYLLNTGMPLLNEIITDRISVRIQCLETPTQGSITVKIVGIPN
ncbi:MAG: hypothetical protein FWJ66_11985 [Caldibacillus sp.]